MAFILGIHIGCTVAYQNMVQFSKELGIDAFQFFTFNTTGKRVTKRIEKADMLFFKDSLEKGDISTLLAHAPSVLNLCSPYPCKENALEIMKEDKALMEIIPGISYVLNPGKPLGQGKKVGIELLSRELNDYLDADMKSSVLLETSSGKRNAIGKTFGEMSTIIRKVEHSDKIGICFDVSNVYAAGYDLVNNLEGVLEEFDKIIGIDRLKAIQLADHKGKLGGMDDTRASLGTGSIGIDAIIRIINHPLLKSLPFYLKTPHVPAHRREIEVLKKNYG